MDIISSEFLGNYHLYRFNTLTVRRRMKRRGKNDMHHLNIGGFPIMLHRQGMYCRINPFQMLIPWKKTTDNSPGWLWKKIKGNKPHTLTCYMAQSLLVRCILIPTQSKYFFFLWSGTSAPTDTREALSFRDDGTEIASVRTANESTVCTTRGTLLLCSGWSSWNPEDDWELAWLWVLLPLPLAHTDFLCNQGNKAC